MPKTINVLFLAAEAEPFIKVGGLGDVAGALPRVLRSLSTDELKIDVRLVIPHHPSVKTGNGSLRPLGMYSIARGETEIQVEVQETQLDGMPVYLIGGEPINASGSVYSTNSLVDAEKYIFFSLAALALPKLINWQPDLVHANDWHTAMSAYGTLAQRWEEGQRHIATVLTLHNLPFMGPDSSAIIEAYKLKLAQTDLPEWARVMPLPLGLWASDAIVAVSPTYGNEILQPEYGCGLNEFFLSRRETVSGILNGLDTVSFNPADDAALGVNFDLESLDKRSANKGLLQSRLGLPQDPVSPMIAMVGRMDVQKGVDLALTALKGMGKLNWQAVILGTGSPKLEEAALALQTAFPDRIKVETRYDAGLARQIYAGSDMLLMPSRYEPCGLAQMIAMRYGCIPVVRAAGGLNDTVEHGETGFVFQKAHHLSLLSAIKSAIKVYADPEKWKQIQKNGMSKDFAWETSARSYLNLYQSLIKP